MSFDSKNPLKRKKERKKESDLTQCYFTKCNAGLAYVCVCQVFGMHALIHAHPTNENARTFAHVQLSKRKLYFGKIYSCIDNVHH